MVTSIHALCFNQRIRLDNLQTDEPTLLPSSTITLELEGSALPSYAYLNNLRVPVTLNETQSRGYLVYDFHRSVGFHRFELADKLCIFGTEDSKLQLTGIEQMLDYVHAAGLSWGYQLFFSEGTSIRHPKVDYAWLTARAAEIIELAQSIATSPVKKGVFVERKSRPTGGRVLLSETFQLLRQNPKLYLEKHPAGSVHVAADRYHPRAVVVRKAIDSTQTIANRRVTVLLTSCAEIAASIEPHVPKGSRVAVRSIQAQCESLLQELPFSALIHLSTALPSAPAAEEQMDDRYSRLFEIFEELQTQLAWEPGTKSSSAFAYIEYADQIYQSFVALTIAAALDVPLCVPALKPGLSEPSFKSQRYEIFYDATPPKAKFSNWRDSSGRPADMRPDLTIIDVEANTGLLIDAKYRVEKSGSLPSSALNEAQVYMQSFGVSHIALCYPGAVLQPNFVSADGNTIVEIPLRPDAALRDYLRATIAPALLGLMEPLN